MLIVRVAEKSVSFEVSLGNAGNGVDGELTTGNKSENFDNDDERKCLINFLENAFVTFYAKVLVFVYWAEISTTFCYRTFKDNVQKFL